MSVRNQANKKKIPHELTLASTISRQASIKAPARQGNIPSHPNRGTSRAPEVTRCGGGGDPHIKSQEISANADHEKSKYEKGIMVMVSSVPNDEKLACLLRMI
jgi:hypothetical protein